jgi:glycosyltransferase involved in cell wall biosynthesis
VTGMPVHVVGNAPFIATGYGTQIDQLTGQLVAAGYDTAVTCNYGLQGARMDWNGMTLYPPGFDVWANDTIGGNARHHFAGRRGWVLTLFDVWVAKGPSWSEMDVASWVPVDHVPTPPKVGLFFKQTGSVPIAMSEFGERMLAKEGLEPFYAPHGIDTDLFRPGITEVNGVPPRGLFDVPEDAFVVGMVAANKGVYPCRKSFPQALLAFSQFCQRHDDAVLVLHTERFGMASGIELDRLIQACGIPDDRIFFVDQWAYRTGIDQETMAAMYNAFDVLLAPSMGEGFGIPVIEAQACGVPVIVSDFSAQPELVGSGWTVGGTPFWDEAQAAWMHTPDPQAIVSALEEAYAGEGNPTNARAKALTYDQRLVFETHWKPILAELERRVSLPDVEATPIDLGALA